MLDLFGTQYSRYARRNKHSAIKTELEAVSGSDKSPSSFGTMNLQNLFSKPVVKRGAEKLSKAKTDSDIGRNIVGLLPAGMTIVTKIECRGPSCTVKKKCA